MSEMLKEIKEIILHKNDPLAKKLEGLSGDQIEQTLLDVERIVANSVSYPLGRLVDPNLGHWDIYRGSEENKSTISFQLSRPLMARSPNLDIKKGKVAIDFGTKSTMVAILDEEAEKIDTRLLRIGAGQYLKEKEKKEDYENPTFMHFVNIDYFEGDYHSIKSRPLTRWEDLRVAYGAMAEFEDADDAEFYQYFSDLKQWANDQSKTPFNIVDENGNKQLKKLVDCGEKDFNPIEVYAYYIGRYINNMNNGIFLEYVLSYPVKYPKNVREKIKESFERGLKKSIPHAVLSHPENGKKFSVEISTSEPAAYAISALKEYGFYKKDAFKREKEHYYGVFDFGGGTTDFDFGVWKRSSGRYNVEIEHFKSGGNDKLGGENLLELLAYEVFVDNEDVMRENGCCFPKPNYPILIPGNIQNLISTSQKAKKNMRKLMEVLRPFWENAHIFKEEMQEDHKSLSQGEKDLQAKFNVGTREIYLSPEGGGNGETFQKPLKIDVRKMLAILEREIQNGVNQFFATFEVAMEEMTTIKKLHIFLGGNSSRSLLVTEAFDKAIEAWDDEVKKTMEFVLYPPLGTPESDKKREELGLSKNDDDYARRVTCKSGVVFGLLDGLPSGKIKVIPEISQDEEAKFGFYLGDEDFDCFKVIFNPNESYGKEAKDILKDDGIYNFALYYTKDPRVVNEELDIGETKMLSVKFDRQEDKGKVYVKILGPNRIKLIARSEDGKTLEEKEFDLED